MLEKPDLPAQLIISAVQDEFGLDAAELTFLPLGYDTNTAVYRLVSTDGTAYFLKLRKGAFAEICVLVPQFLKTQGIRAIIAPLQARNGRLWGSLGIYKLILYPYIEGQNGYALSLTDRQWREFGAALKTIHIAPIPPALSRLIPHETWTPRYRQEVTAFQAQVETVAYTDPVAHKMAEFMRSRQAEINHLVARAESLGSELQYRSQERRSLELVLCHTDIHAGNLLLTPQGDLYIVDWDNPILAPKERDLMFIGMGGVWHAQRQTALFYEGYCPTHGQAQVDWTALAYYRYERIVQDIAAFCEQLLLTTEGGEDREQAYQYLISNFLPNHEFEIARKTDLRSKLLE